MPPVNSADMHRVRQNLNYFHENNCEVTVIAVHEDYIDRDRDQYLIETIPNDVQVIKVKALKSKWTKYLGFSTIAIRAYFNYYKAINLKLKQEHFDLIFISTTMFPLFTLGPIFKSKFNIPFIVDMQDPWVSDYYDTLPSSKRPPKYRLSKFIDNKLEKYTMNHVDGIVSVSLDYINDLEKRYQKLKIVKKIVLTFSAPEHDIEIFNKIKVNLDKRNDASLIKKEYFNITYVGRAGVDMELSITWFLLAIKELLEADQLPRNLKINFIGTSYDPSDSAKKSVMPIASKLLLDKIVYEQTSRVSYFNALNYIKDADLLFIPGSDSSSYTASKIFPYVLLKKPLIALFHEKSSVCEILEEINYPGLTKFNSESDGNLIVHKIKTDLMNIINNKVLEVDYNFEAFEKYTSKNMTTKLVDFFSSVLSNADKNDDVNTLNF